MVGRGTRPQHGLTSSLAQATATCTPGKRTLVEGSTHAMPPRRVADAASNEPNAVIKVVAFSNGKILGKPWGAKGRWEGPLPQRYTGIRGAAGWTWDNPDAKSVRLGSDLDGRGGRTVEAWAGAGADKIVIYASALDAVTSDEEAEKDAHAPGHATDKRDAGDGSTRSVKQADTGPGTDQAEQGRNHGDVGTQGGTGGHEPSAHDDGVRDGDRESSDGDEELADDFEHELGLDLNGEDDETGETGDPPGPASGKDKPGSGRTGPDTRAGGTGPGGERARPDGDGRGSEGGGRGGAEDGSRDGTQGGARNGMYGGEGKAGDGGVPSAVALFGGLISVPAALRGFVELALIVSSADVTGAGSQLFKQGLGKIASAAAARRMIAHEARVAAVQETKLALKRIAMDKQTAAAWAKATAAEKKQVTRTIYWELQRKYFQGYLAAARRAKAEAKAALRKAPRSASAQQSLKRVEMAEEAAAAPPVAGQLPRNHEFAGKQFPADLLPPAYRRQGLRFSEAGYPDFSPYAQTLPNGQKSVQITYTGSRSGDLAAANAKAGYKKTPPRVTWHHHEDMKTMLLVPMDLHDTIKHTGGVATYKHTSGIAKYGN